jgi:hypothetical protein
MQAVCLSNVQTQVVFNSNRVNHSHNLNKEGEGKIKVVEIQITSITNHPTSQGVCD